MRAIGRTIYKMAKVATSIKAVRCIEDTSKIHSSTVEDSNSFKMVINTKVNINKANHMDTENTSGKTEMSTSVISLMARAQAKER